MRQNPPFPLPRGDDGGIMSAVPAWRTMSIKERFDMYRKNAWEHLAEGERAQVMDFAEKYKAYLDVLTMMEISYSPVQNL